MDDKPFLYFSQDKIVTSAFLDDKSYILVTAKTFQIQNFMKSSQKIKIVKVQIPDTQFIEAAQILHKNNFMKIIAAIRIMETPRIYFGYIDCLTGKVINTTAVIKSLNVVNNQQMCFIPETEFITVAYTVGSKVCIWRTDKATQDKLSIESYCDFGSSSAEIARTEYNKLLDKVCPSPEPVAHCITAGAFLNRLCLFVGYTDELRVFAVQHNYQYFCSLKSTGTPIQMVYHPNFHQIACLNNDNLLQFFELNVKNLNDFQIEHNLVTYPVHSTRFACTQIMNTMLGYLVGDTYGRVFAFKICKNNIQVVNLSEVEKKSDEAKEEEKKQAAKFTVSQIQIDQTELKTRKLNRKQEEVNELIQQFPFTCRVQGYQEMLAGAVLGIASLDGNELLFSCIARNTIAVGGVQNLIKQDELLTQNLGFSMITFTCFINLKRYFLTLDNKQLKQENQIINDSTSLQKQVELLNSQFVDISQDIYKIVQAYLNSMNAQRAELGNVGQDKTNQALINGEQVYDQLQKIGKEDEPKAKDKNDEFRDPWVKMFTKAQTQQDDIKLFVESILQPLTDDPITEQKQIGISELVLDKLPFLAAFVRSMRKRYWKGVKELKEVVFKMEPQLNSFQIISEHYQNRDLEQIKEKRQESLNNIVDAVRIELYSSVIKKLDDEAIQIGRCKPLLKGTSHKYMLSQYEVQNWTANQEHFQVLRTKMILHIKGIHARFNGLKDIFTEQLKQINLQTTDNFKTKFAEASGEMCTISSKASKYIIANKRIYQMSEIAADMSDAVMDFRENKKTSVEPACGVVYDCLDFVKGSQLYVIRLVSKVPGEQLEAAEQYDTKMFGSKFLKMIEVVEMPDENKNIVNYWMILERPENTFPLLTLAKYALQKVYKIPVYSEPVFHALDESLKTFITLSPLTTVSMIIYNILKIYALDADNKLQNLPLCLSNVIININTLQVYLPPTAILQQSLSRTEAMVEFNVPISAPECLLNLCSQKSISWSLGMIMLIIVPLFKLIQRKEEDSKDLETSFLKIFDLLKEQYSITQEINQSNTQIMAQRKEKFNPLENQLGIPPQHLKALIAIIRLQCCFSYDIQKVPLAAQANDLLLTFMDSSNVQLANFILANSLIQPFQDAEEQKPRFEERCFRSGSTFISQIIEQLNFSETSTKRLIDFMNATLIFSQTARFEVQKLIKLPLFKSCESTIRENEKQFTAQDNEKSIKMEQERRKIEVQWRMRPWRGKYEIEYTFEKTQRQEAMTEAELIEYNKQKEQVLEQQKQQPNLNPQQWWEQEQVIEQQRFQNEKVKLDQVIQYEDQVKQQLKPNEIGDAFFDNNEPIPEEEPHDKVNDDKAKKADKEKGEDKKQEEQVVEYDPMAQGNTENAQQYVYEQPIDPQYVQPENVQVNEQVQPEAQPDQNQGQQPANVQQPVDQATNQQQVVNYDNYYEQGYYNYDANNNNQGYNYDNYNQGYGYDQGYQPEAKANVQPEGEYKQGEYNQDKADEI